jgi:hypothetical protein
MTVRLERRLFRHCLLLLAVIGPCHDGVLRSERTIVPGTDAPAGQLEEADEVITVATQLLGYCCTCVSIVDTSSFSGGLGSP